MNFWEVSRVKVFGLKMGSAEAARDSCPSCTHSTILRQDSKGAFQVIRLVWMEMDLVALLQQTEVPPLPPRRPNENSGQNTRSTGGNTVGGDLNGMHSTAADASTSGMVAAAQTGKWCA